MRLSHLTNKFLAPSTQKVRSDELFQYYEKVTTIIFKKNIDKTVEGC